MSTTRKKFNPITWFFNYVKEAKEEMNKVTWPSREETIKYSIITIALSVFIAAFFGGIDHLLTLGLEELIQLTA